MKLGKDELSWVAETIGRVEVEASIDILDAIAARFQEIVDHETVQERDEHLLQPCALLLATYEVVAQNAGVAVAEKLINALIAESAGADPRWLRVRYGIDPDRPEQAFDTAAVRFKAKGEEIFGPQFTYVQDRLDENHSWVNITRCYFNNFFRRYCRPELTAVFCAGDVPFTEELSKPQYSLLFERPTAMGLGGDECRFRFTRRSGTEAAAPTELQ